jgi:1,4-dihydroxy-2-naphthoate octaprenyltransferase
MSQATWLQALRTVPQVNKEMWTSLNGFTRWLVASRFSVTIMTFTSAFIGIILAAKDGPIDPLLATLCVIGLVLAHATNNLINDYTDSIKGVDEGNYFRTKYGTHVLEHGLMTKKGLLGYIALTGGLAISTGLAIIYLRGVDVIYLMLSGAFFVLFYTWPLKKLALGEVSVLIVWGPLMVGGAYLVSSGHWSESAAWIGALYALGPTAVIFGKHIDKIQMDTQKKIHSLPVLLGEKKALAVSKLMLISPFLLAGYLFSIQVIGYGVLLLLFAVPTMLQTLKVFNQARPKEMPEGFRAEVWPLWYAPHAFQFTRKFSLYFLLMLVAESIIASI